jgi:hypothetical protein
MTDAMTSGGYTRSYGTNADANRVKPRFHMQEEEDPRASQSAGRPIYKQREMVEILMPGNAWNRPDVYVTDEHKQRWPDEYAAFKKGIELAPHGTPLEHWPRLKRNQVLELKAKGFATVEELADMSDTIGQQLGMGWMQLRAIAKAFIDEGAKHALEEKLMAENNKLAGQVEGMKGELENMRALMAQMHGELMEKRNAPNEIQTFMTPQHDLPEPEAPTISSLAEFAQERPVDPGHADAIAPQRRKVRKNG